MLLFLAYVKWVGESAPGSGKVGKKGDFTLNLFKEIGISDILYERKPN